MRRQVAIKPCVASSLGGAVASIGDGGESNCVVIIFFTTINLLVHQIFRNVFEMLTIVLSYFFDRQENPSTLGYGGVFSVNPPGDHLSGGPSEVYPLKICVSTLSYR